MKIPPHSINGVINTGAILTATSREDEIVAIK